MLGPDARAQAPSVGQVVGTASEIRNERGELLPGTDPGASFFGIPSVEGALVQVLQTMDGQVYPPQPNGQPDSRNVVLMTTRVGYGYKASQAISGRFGATVTPRPGGNSKLFVRVFNAPSLQEASFYGDSQVFTVKSWKNEVFTANIAATTQPLEAGDSDGDGLSDSWEKSFGTDLAARDTDQDGLTDGEEIFAGTDALEAGSAVVVAELSFAGGTDGLLAWDSQEGRRYDVERRIGAFEGSGSFGMVTSLDGTGDRLEVVIPDAFAGDLAAYRIRVR